MILHLRLTEVYLILLTSFALAALQNVTVDDATLSGPVIPQYIPQGSPPPWNQGADCSVCLVRPDPSLAYDGTWHDTTFYPGNGVSQAVDFTFIGSALYIFFILANNITGATTFTDVNFIMDGETVGTFVHNPSSSPDFQYNVPVYVNKSLASGQHTMTIEPANSGNQVLILFDYLIYSVDTDSITSSGSPSPTTSATAGKSSAQNVGAIVGGTVAGVAAVLIATAFFMCYRRRRKRNLIRPPQGEAELVEPFISITPEAPVTFKPLMPVHQTAPTLTKVGSRSSANVPSIPSTSPPSGPSSSDAAGLVEQVGLLREEVANLRQLHNRDRDRSDIDLGSLPPPEYSESLTH